MEIINSEYMAWDAKKGNLTQASSRGSLLEDVITIPTATALSAGDVVYLKNYKSSSVITNMTLTSKAYVRSVDVEVQVCLLGLDPITKNPFMFKYTNGGADITDNFLTNVVEGSATTHKISGAFKLDKTKDAFLDLKGYTCRGNEKTVTTSKQVTNANANNLWKFMQGDQTIAQVAEYAMSNMYKLDGSVSNTKAYNYDPSQRKGYLEFGLGIVFTSALTAAQLEELGLKVSIEYKDSMLSETSYGINYIPATVTY